MESQARPGWRKKFWIHVLCTRALTAENDDVVSGPYRHVVGLEEVVAEERAVQVGNQELVSVVLASEAESLRGAP